MWHVGLWLPTVLLKGSTTRRRSVLDRQCSALGARHGSLPAVRCSAFISAPHHGMYNSATPCFSCDALPLLALPKPLRCQPPIAAACGTPAAPAPPPAAVAARPVPVPCPGNTGSVPVAGCARAGCRPAAPAAAAGWQGLLWQLLITHSTTRWSDSRYRTRIRRGPARRLNRRPATATPWSTAATALSNTAAARCTRG